MLLGFVDDDGDKISSQVLSILSVCVDCASAKKKYETLVRDVLSINKEIIRTTNKDNREETVLLLLWSGRGKGSRRVSIDSIIVKLSGKVASGMTVYSFVPSFLFFFSFFDLVPGSGRKDFLPILQLDRFLLVNQNVKDGPNKTTFFCNSSPCDQASIASIGQYRPKRIDCNFCCCSAVFLSSPSNCFTARR